MGVGADLRVVVGVGVGAEDLLVVGRERPVADADAPPLVVSLPEGAVEVPDGLVHLEGMGIQGYSM